MEGEPIIKSRPLNGLTRTIALLQGVIISFIAIGSTVFGVLYSNSVDSIKAIRSDVGQIKVNQGIFGAVQENVLKELDDNKAEHKEIIEMIKR